MDIFDFLSALRRQRRTLTLGALVLIAAVFTMTFKFGDDGIESRIDPKFEAVLQMAVVPAEVETLADSEMSEDLSRTAVVYSQLLQSAEAAREIQDAQDVELTDELVVNVTSGTGIMEVLATATTQEGAARAALGSFFWLEGRLAKPLVLAAVPAATTTTIASPLANSSGTFLSEIQLDVDASYASADRELFLGISTPTDTGFSLPLQDAAFAQQSFPVFLSNGDTVTITLQTTLGVPLAEVTAEIPELREDLELVPPLRISVQRGAFPLIVDVEGGESATVNQDRLEVKWDLGGLLEAARASAPERVSVVLLTEDPVVEETGTRRAPILIAGVLVAGGLVLLALITTMDAWQQRRREQWTEPAWVDDVAVDPVVTDPVVTDPVPHDSVTLERQTVRTDIPPEN